MFNTEYNGATTTSTCSTPPAQFAFSPKFNVWVGRFLPPSDRANLYGPYYSHHWAVYTDGVQDGYPFIFQGRANGAMYWGQFGKVKVSGGAFDGTSLNGDDTRPRRRPRAGRLLGSGGRLLPERHLLRRQEPAGHRRRRPGAGRATSRPTTSTSCWSGRSAGAAPSRSKPNGPSTTSSAATAASYGTDDGGYVLGAFLFPQMVGPGRFEILGKYAKARFREGFTPLDPDYDQKTTEIDFNYVIKQFNARVMMFYKDTRFDAVRTNFKQFGVGLQLQM